MCQKMCKFFKNIDILQQTLVTIELSIKMGAQGHLWKIVRWRREDITYE